MHLIVSTQHAIEIGLTPSDSPFPNGTLCGIPGLRTSLERLVKLSLAIAKLQRGQACGQNASRVVVWSTTLRMR